MYVRVGTLILPGQFPRLREEWEGLRIEGLEIGDKSKNTFRALLPHTQDSSCLRGSGHFSPQFFSNPDDTFDEFCVILGENTL